MKIALSAALTILALAQPTAAEEKTKLALLGHIDSFTIGQDGYCGDRKTISDPANKVLTLPAQKTWFGIKSKFKAQLFELSCVGEYSYTPEGGKNYFVRYEQVEEKCLLQLFEAAPGEAPVQIRPTYEQSRSCLVK
jgi:hypothetical protein